MRRFPRSLSFYIAASTIYAAIVFVAVHAVYGIELGRVGLAIPDYLERTFYVSGPQAMVKGLRKELLAMGVRRSKIKVDYFPGFA